MRPRLGFLGAGWIGRHRLEALTRAGVAEVAALCDPSEEAVRAARAAAPDAAVLPSLGALLELELDGLVIATPSAQHAEQALAGLSRGLAVFCQKPLGRNAAEVARVVDAARAADRLLGVDLSYRHTEGMTAVRRRIQDGGLGEVFAADLVFHNAYGPDNAWFYDRAHAGGGCLMDLGIHLVDLALWALGFPHVSRVASALRAGGKPLTSQSVEDYAAAQLELESGAVVRLACSWRLPAGQDAVIRADFYGTRGGATFENVGGSFFDFNASVMQGTSRERLCGPKDDWGGRAAVAWARQLARHRGYASEADTFLESARALDRIYQAAGLGLPLAPRPVAPHAR